MRLEAVVVSYRTPADLDAFMRTWTAHPPIGDWRLTIVNVTPTSADFEIGTKWMSERVRYLDTEHNVGYARACNWAAADTDSEYLAFFNADVWFRDDAVSEVLQAMDDHQEWGVVGPRQVDSQNRLTSAGIFGTHQHPKHRSWYERDRGQVCDVKEAITVSGAAYFVRRQCWAQLSECSLYRRACQELGLETVGAFLPTQHYYEETWLSYHAWSHGWPVMYYGPACVIHEWHRASPVGGPAEQGMKAAREQFRHACNIHEILHD